MLYTLPFTSVIQQAGITLRMPTKIFAYELEQSVVFQKLIKRYAKVLFSQLVQKCYLHAFLCSGIAFSKVTFNDPGQITIAVFSYHSGDFGAKIRRAPRRRNQGHMHIAV